MIDRVPGVYARVSTSAQGESLETQLGRLRASVPGATEFVDAGISGRGVERRAFDRLLAEVRAGRVDSVTVTKLDRLGRSARAILEFFNEADANGVRVVALDQAIDTSTPVGRLVRTVLAAMAELEADLTSERTREAMAAFKAGARKTKSGRPVGRPRIYDSSFAARVRELRDALGPDGKRRPWSQLAMQLHRPAGSLRKLYSSPRGAIPSAINGAINPEQDLEH